MMQQAINDYRMVMKQLTGILQSFTQEQFDLAPFEGSWTPGQAAEHILLYQHSIPQLLAGETRITNRPAYANRQSLADIFLNYEAKYASPSSIMPSNEHHAQQSLIIELENISRPIIKNAQLYDPGEECLDIEMPGLGKLTRLEWMYFLVYHTQRHVHQLQNIYLSMAA